MEGTTTRVRTVVLGGNPNVGKTTLFNRLTGGHARVGNYPGVTVERHEGPVSLPDLTQARLLDSPGCYSLCARSLDEWMAVRSLVGLPPEAEPDAVLIVLDATQLERNLYLALQLAELGVPMVLAVNLMDEARREGTEVDVGALAREIGVPVVAVSARKNEGIDELRRALAAVLYDPDRGRPRLPPRRLGDKMPKTLEAVEERVPETWHRGQPSRRRALAIWALLTLEEGDEVVGVPTSLRAAAAAARAQAEAERRDLERELIEPLWVEADRLRSLAVREHRTARELTRRIDAVLLHPVAGFGLFLIIMALAFQALFAGADPFIALIERGVAAVADLVAPLLPAGLVREFVVDGLVAGIGAFVVFLPQIAFLFLFLSLLEDTGYLSRVAVLMDRLMGALGLHGRAFVPMLSAYACAVPAILATRTLERRRDRLLTVLVLPLMTCSARLPVYGLVVAVMVPAGEHRALVQGVLLASLYLLGTAAALVSAFVLGRFVLRAPRTPLVVELPPYRLPHWGSVLRQVGERCLAFVRRAGSVILLGSIALWLLLNFPRDARVEARFAALREQALAAVREGEPDAGASLARIEARWRAERTRRSYAGRVGHFLLPVLSPLGFDESIGVGLIGAFAAREVFVSTMGVVYGVGGEVNEESPALRERLRAATWPDGRPVFTAWTCLALLVFFALACQCMSTLAVAARETGSWLWPAFMFSYMLVLAWTFAFAVQQAGRLLAG